MTTGAQAAPTSRMQRVLAGPGSGKTRLLVTEITTRLQTGMDAGAILGMTFTRRAAKEMVDRVRKATGKTPWLGTFHALARRILVDLKLLGAAVDLEKLIPDATAALQAGQVPAWLKKVRFIAVDEAQDLDHTQVQFLKSLRQHTQEDGLLLVGDPDQSIYRFRGASPEFLLKAGEVFERQVETVTLGANHRSCPAIVHTARSLLSPYADPQSPCHSLEAIRTEAHPAVRWIEARTEEEEAHRIFEEIETLRALNVPLTEITILVRVRHQIPVLQREAERWNIPLYLPPLKDQLDRDAQEAPEPPANSVQLMTMHQAKCTEFLVVFLAGVQDGLMPYRLAKTEEACYEELRLLYVAMTRAKQVLWFCHHGTLSPFLRRVRTARLQPIRPPERPSTPTTTTVAPVPQAHPGRPMTPVTENVLHQILAWVRKGFGG